MAALEAKLEAGVEMLREHIACLSIAAENGTQHVGQEPAWDLVKRLHLALTGMPWQNTSDSRPSGEHSLQFALLLL